MKFKVGDKVKVVSLDYREGIVDSFYEALRETRIVVAIDDPETIEMLTPKEHVELAKAAETSRLMYHTVEQDLLHVTISSKPESDWKDIWDSNY